MKKLRESMQHEIVEASHSAQQLISATGHRESDEAVDLDQVSVGDTDESLLAAPNFTTIDPFKHVARSVTSSIVDNDDSLDEDLFLKRVGEVYPMRRTRSMPDLLVNTFVDGDKAYSELSCLELVQFSVGIERDMMQQRVFDADVLKLNPYGAIFGSMASAKAAAIIDLAATDLDKPVDAPSLAKDTPQATVFASRDVFSHAAIFESKALDAAATFADDATRDTAVQDVCVCLSLISLNTLLICVSLIHSIMLLLALSSIAW